MGIYTSPSATWQTPICRVPLHRHGARGPRRRAAHALRPLHDARVAARSGLTGVPAPPPLARLLLLLSRPLRAPQREWRQTSSTRVAADFLNAQRKPANGPRLCLKTFGSWVHILVNGKFRFAKLLEMSYFSTSHLLFRVGKLQQMTKKKCQTIGDTTLHHTANGYYLSRIQPYVLHDIFFLSMRPFARLFCIYF